MKTNITVKPNFTSKCGKLAKNIMNEKKPFLIWSKKTGKIFEPVCYASIDNSELSFRMTSMRPVLFTVNNTGVESSNSLMAADEDVIALALFIKGKMLDSPCGYFNNKTLSEFILSSLHDLNLYCTFGKEREVTLGDLIDVPREYIKEVTFTNTVQAI